MLEVDAHGYSNQQYVCDRGVKEKHFAVYNIFLLGFIWSFALFRTQAQQADDSSITIGSIDCLMDVLG